MIEFIGWLGAFLLAFCGVPQAWQSYKDKHSYGLSWGFINMWFFGEIFLILYISFTSQDIILIANYAVNLVIGYTIIHYKMFPKRPKELYLGQYPE